MRYLDAKQAGALIGVSPDTIYRYAREGKLQKHTVGLRLVRFAEPDVAALAVRESCVAGCAGCCPRPQVCDRCKEAPPTWCARCESCACWCDCPALPPGDPLEPLPMTGAVQPSLLGAL